MSVIESLDNPAKVRRRHVKPLSAKVARMHPLTSAAPARPVRTSRDAVRRLLAKRGIPRFV